MPIWPGSGVGISSEGQMANSTLCLCLTEREKENRRALPVFIITIIIIIIIVCTRGQHGCYMQVLQCHPPPWEGLSEAWSLPIKPHWQPESPRDPLVSTSPALGLQVCAMMCCLLGFCGPSSVPCLQSEHFHWQSHRPPALS